MMGLDPGGRRIGVALSDPTGLLASAHSVLRRTTQEGDLLALRRIAEEHGVVRVVIGLPLHMSGEEGEEAELARALACEVEAALGVPVSLVDERLSSVEADRRLLELGVPRKHWRARRDAVAAAVVLQSYLDGLRYERARAANR